MNDVALIVQRFAKTLTTAKVVALCQTWGELTTTLAPCEDVSRVIDLASVRLRFPLHPTYQGRQTQQLQKASANESKPDRCKPDRFYCCSSHCQIVAPHRLSKAGINSPCLQKRRLSVFAGVNQ